MQSASSRIWTRIAVSISYDDNHYTTGTSRCRSRSIIITTVRLHHLDAYDMHGEKARR